MLGTLYLRARYDILGRAETYIGIFSLVTLFSIAVAFLLSRRLQSSITEPLDAMAVIARKIVDQRDYSLRVMKKSDDEIGVVVDAFNNMIEEVGIRYLSLGTVQSSAGTKWKYASPRAALSLATAPGERHGRRGNRRLAVDV